MPTNELSLKAAAITAEKSARFAWNQYDKVLDAHGATTQVTQAARSKADARQATATAARKAYNAVRFA